MTCGLIHASYSLPEWQAVKLTFFAPCSSAICFGTSRLLCCLIVGIHTSGISISLSLLMLLGWSLMWITPNPKRAPVKLTSPWTFKPCPEVDNVWSFRVGRWSYHCHHWCRLSDWSYGKITETLFLLSVVTHFSAWKVYKFYHLWGWAAFKGIREGCLIFFWDFFYGTLNIYQSELS